MGVATLPDQNCLIGDLGLPWPSEDESETAPALLAIFGVAISCMAEVFSILKRKTKGSSSNSESGVLTPKEKRFCESSFEADDEVNIALDMAEDLGSKLQLVLQKLTSLESMVEGVLQRFNNLESSDFKLLSLNVRWIRSPTKRKALFLLAC